MAEHPSTLGCFGMAAPLAQAPEELRLFLRRRGRLARTNPKFPRHFGDR
jgi:hypothetical protein